MGGSIITTTPTIGHFHLCTGQYHVVFCGSDYIWGKVWESVFID